jgi:Fe-S cluster assembly iron-binding protein IscA
MLTMTENAATAVKGILAQNPGNDDAGLRIHGADDPGAGFALSVATPEESDQVVETSGARVFLDETASAALTDRVLDAKVDEQGGVRFELAEQA